MTNAIEVPDYVADEFNRRTSHPSGKIGAANKSLVRVFRLINETLKDFDDQDWEIDDGHHHSRFLNEPYGLEADNERIYVYARERGEKRPIAIFKSPYQAADYFVWLVAKGRCGIDWELFLDMEP